MSIVEFLTARYDEDERIAQGAIHRGDGSWRAGWDPAALTCDDRRGPSSGVGEVVDQGGYSVTFGTPTDGQAIHIARHDPARVLADLAAKRRLLELHDPDGLDRCPAVVNETSIRVERWYDFDNPCPTLRLLAAPFADHPDYDQTWAIEA